jgi:hypothetical protein
MDRQNIKPRINYRTTIMQKKQMEMISNKIANRTLGLSNKIIIIIIYKNNNNNVLTEESVLLICTK